MERRWEGKVSEERKPGALWLWYSAKVSILRGHHSRLLDLIAFEETRAR